MTDVRKGQIAYALLKYRMGKEGVPLNREELQRSVGNIAKAVNVDSAELIEFTEITVRELVDTTFSQRVRVVN